MPNWCENIIIVKGSRLKEFKKTMNKPDSNGKVCEFSFYHTVKNGGFDLLKPVDVSDFMRNTNKNVEYWGTKWDVSEPKIEVNNDMELRIRCQTAWKPPVIWAMRVQRDWDNDVDIEIHYVEDGVGFYGSYNIHKYGYTDMQCKIRDNNEYDDETGENVKKGIYKEFYDKWF
jgi:hypothetical protein